VARPSGAPIVAAAGGITLFVLATLTNNRLWDDFRTRPWFFVCLGVLEGLNLILYLFALTSGPLPVVVSLHLCTPILLVLAAVIRRGRPITPTLGLELALIAGAILLVSRRRREY